MLNNPANPTTEQLSTSCCIVGGGPAGMMLGFLLARAGVDVIVLEKHSDFLRDFRGDTIHPSTLELMAELGLLEAFLKRPHQELSAITFTIGGETITAADFAHLPTRCKFIAFMPQWEFLNFLAEAGQRYPNFHLMMEADVTDLLIEGGRVAAVAAQTPRGKVEVRASLIVGADGRRSIVREQAGLTVQAFGVPIDILWTSIPRIPGLGQSSLGYIDAGQFMVLIDRGDYFQCGFMIPKGTFEAFKQRGLEAFRADIVRLAPFMRASVAALNDWDSVKLLTVVIDRLGRWYRPGLLCIGDAAHAMSPAGGVGINLAIQDAVAAANLLAGPLRQGRISVEELRQVQRRRELPVRLIQSMQAFIHNTLLGPRAPGRSSRAIRLPIWLMRNLPVLRRLTARVIGLGFRPEHVQTSDEATKG